MNLLRRKFDEVLRSLLPVVVLVMLLSLTLVKADEQTIANFLLGALLLLVGLGIFLLGVDLAMIPIGTHMATEVATSKSIWRIALLAFLMGLLVTVAEPDLQILGAQVEAASGGAISGRMMVFLVSVGVGFLITLGTIRLLSGKMSYAMFMALAYAGILILSIFVSEEFLAISFDSSGATTGALTTPFILALSAGLSKVKGGKSTEEDSFGMVGVMSAGPMYALMLMSIITGQKKIVGFPAATKTLSAIELFPHELLNAVIALAPLCAMFFFLNFIHFKAPKREIMGIIKGIIYTIFGLALFLTGVNSGFMDMGKLIGARIAGNYLWLLPGVGLMLGAIVVLMEPAVIVLGHQIEEVTGGRIPLNMIRLTLSIGVALAIGCSMLRIMIPSVKLWYFLLPGFLLGVILSFQADPVFVGIAYDAGGVASGPMTATFVLAFAQGAAMQIPTANVMVDGFGVIAMVAMAPVLSIMILGAIFRHKEATVPEKTRQPLPASAHLAGKIQDYDCVIAILEKGLADEAVALARETGARGATILNGRGSGGQHMHLFSFEVQKEKEVVFWLVDARITDKMAQHIHDSLDLGSQGSGTVFILPSGAIGLDAPVTIGQSPRHMSAERETES
ncbi:MAG TPA: DUF1538 family protein [Clostridiales bacterium]|mgnify:CR=1 FL=1|jgi:nitrogen regulatory protein PII|nr:DUF1538 family protein [Clostridiales bacterium]